MKKILITILAIIIALIIASLGASHILKGKVITATNHALDKKLNARIEYSSYKLSLLGDFPYSTVKLRNAQIINEEEEQESDTLLSAQFVLGKINLFSLLKSDICIKELTITNPDIKCSANDFKQKEHQRNDNSKNKKSKQKAKKKNKLDWELEKLVIDNGVFIYSDTSKHFISHLSGININISGKMFGDSTLLLTQTSIDNISLTANNIQYITNTSLSLSSAVNANIDKKIFNINKNILTFNKLPFEASGTIKIPNDTLFSDIQIKTQSSDFSNFFALVPPVFRSYLKDASTEGATTIEANINGYFYKKEYPQTDIKIQVTDGKLKFPDKPQAIVKIGIDANLHKPQGKLSLTEIKINKATAKIKSDSVNLQLKITSPFKEPFFDGKFNGKLNLNELKQSLPIKNTNISGNISVNIRAKGSYSDITNEVYDKIQANGSITLNNVIYKSPEFAKKILIPSGQLSFSPKNVNLKSFKLKIGQSDLMLYGQISNYLNYIIHDSALKGNLQLQSNLINTNELLRLKKSDKKDNSSLSKEKEQQTDKKKTKEKLAFDIPENLNVIVNANIKKILSGKINITNTTGKFYTNNGKLTLSNLHTNLLKGEMQINGNYQNTSKNQPLVDFDIDAKNLDFPTMCRTIPSMRKLISGTNASCKGSLNAKIKLKGQLTPQLIFVPESKNGAGNIQSKNIQINNSKLFSQLDNVLDKRKLQHITIDNFDAYFTIKNGNIDIEPFSTKVIDQETKIAGSMSVKKELDMRIDFNIERKMFGSDIQKLLKIIPGNEKITKLPAGVNVVGSLEKPEFKMDLSETQKAVKNATKDDIKKSLNKLGETFKGLFK